MWCAYPLTYLVHLQIAEDDKFTKNICIKCCSTLQTMCEFIEQVRKAQDNLHNLSLTTDMTDSSTSILNAIKEETIEYTEICIDPTQIYMPDETCTEQYIYPDAEEVVTLKLIGKNEDVQNKTQESNQMKKKFICKVCNRSFLVEQSLKNHSWVHIQDEEYPCFTCQRSFRFQADLNKHIKSHMRKGSGFSLSCEVCGRR